MKTTLKFVFIFLLGSATASALVLTRDRWMSDGQPRAGSRVPTAKTAMAERRASVRGAIEAKTPALQRCYEDYLAGGPQVPAGSLRIGWRIEPDGAVTSAVTVASDFSAPAFERCVLEHIQHWSFRPSASGEPTDVAHKFTFHQRTPASLEF